MHWGLGHRGWLALVGLAARALLGAMGELAATLAWAEKRANERGSASIGHASWANTLGVDVYRLAI